MKPGEYKTSPNGRNRLFVQPDGNVCLYYNNVPTWCTDTYGKTLSSLDLQGDGNLVLYDTNREAIWNSRTIFHDADLYISLQVQNDANLRLWVGSTSWSGNYRWSTETRRYRYIEFRNSGRRVVCNPLLLDVNNKEVYSGVWDGTYWNIFQGISKAIAKGRFKAPLLTLVQVKARLSISGQTLAKTTSISMDVVAAGTAWLDQ